MDRGTIFPTTTDIFQYSSLCFIGIWPPKSPLVLHLAVCNERSFLSRGANDVTVEGDSSNLWRSIARIIMNVESCIPENGSSFLMAVIGVIDQAEDDNITCCRFNVPNLKQNRIH